MSANDESAGREAAAFTRLREILGAAAPNAPGLAAQLAGVDIAALRSRADLARVPALLKSGLKAMQEAAPPFGGLAATRPAQLKRLMVSPGPIFEPEGFGADARQRAIRNLHPLSGTPSPDCPGPAGRRE